MHTVHTRLHGGILKRLLIAIAIALVLALVTGVLMIDSIARTGINAAGTYALGVPTSVTEVSIGLLSGESSIQGLAVDNPAGFADAKILTLDRVQLGAGISTILGERIVVDRVAFTGLTLDLEKHADGTLNVTKLVDHLKEVTGSSDTKEPAAMGESKEVVIKELRLEKIRVNLRNMVGGKSGVIEVNLPDLVLRDLSSKGGVDVLTSEISGVVLGSVMEAVLAANIEGLGADVIGGLRGAVDGVGSVIPASLKDAVSKGIQDAGSALEGVGKLLGTQLKKLLSGDAGKSLQEGVGKALDGILGGNK